MSSVSWWYSLEFWLRPLRPRRQQYVALGDSYSSGVGSRTFYSESGECKRSPYAYGPLVAAAKGYTLSFQACGGAKTNEVVEKQLGTLSSTTALVTISIGGNDAGFGHVMEECAVYYFWCGEAIEEADTYIKNSLPKALETTYKAIRAKATTAQVIVLGLSEAVHQRRRDVRRQHTHLGQREENQRIGGKTRRRDQDEGRSAEIHLRQPDECIRIARGVLVLRMAER